MCWGLALALAVLALGAVSASAAPRPTAVVLYQPASETFTDPTYPKTVAKVMFGSGSPEPWGFTVRQYYLTQTFGAVDFTGGIADIFGPYLVNVPKTGCPVETWNAEANQAAAADGFQPSAYAHVIHIGPGSAPSCPGVGLGNSDLTWAAYLDPFTIVHELGHTLGATHAATYRCRAADGVTRVSLSANCIEAVGEPEDFITEYGDPFDPMGFGLNSEMPPEMSAWRKFGIGAIPATDAPTVTQSGTYTIAPLEVPSGTRLLRVPDGSGDYFDVDFRQPIGPFDGILETNEPVVNGVTVRLDPATFGLGQHNTWLLDMKPETATFVDAPLTAGKLFRDDRTGLEIETLGVSPIGATVRIANVPKQPVPPCRVPRVNYQKLKDAKRRIAASTCVLGKVVRLHSRRIGKGRVIRSRPPGFKRVADGTKVKLFVSSGPPKQKKRRAIRPPRG